MPGGMLGIGFIPVSGIPQMNLYQVYKKFNGLKKII